MAQIIPQSSFANSLGQLTGNALGAGLNAYAEAKLEKMIKKQRMAHAQAGLEGLGYSPAEAAQLAQFDPQILKEIVKAKGKQPSESYINALNAQYGGGQQEQESPLAALGQLQQGKNAPEQKLDMAQLLQQLSTNPAALKLGGLGQQSGSQFEPIQQQEVSPPVAQQREAARGQRAPIDFKGMTHKEIENFLKLQNENPNKPKIQPKHYDALVKQKETLQDIIATTRSMLNTLKKGVNVGIIPSAKAYLAPTLLDENSEIFDKDASHLVNLTTGEVKGPASRFRVALIEKEKPGLKHSKRVNEQILERYLKKAETNLESLDKQYPELGNVESYESALAQTESVPPKAAKVLDKLNSSEPASDYEEGTEVKVGGYTFVSQNGQWVYKG